MTRKGQHVRKHYRLSQRTGKVFTAGRGKSANLVVELRSVPNVDLMNGQWNGTGYWGAIPPKRVFYASVSSFKEASERCMRYIHKYGLGSGNWSGGNVTRNGKIIAHVSYNGTVWKGPRYYFKGKAKALYRPEVYYL